MFWRWSNCSVCLGGRVFSSIGDFTKFLCGTSIERPLPVPTRADWPEMEFEGVQAVSDTDSALIRDLFRPLRIDWIDGHCTKPGKLGLTILPGRQDMGRDLPDDIAAITAAGVTHIVPLITDEEFVEYGVDDLLEAYQQAGLTVHRLPILDQGVCSLQEMGVMVAWLQTHLDAGANILIHCVGGLGRSGMLTACYLTSHNLDAATAIDEVRRARSPRAVESAVQEAFIRDFAGR